MKFHLFILSIYLLLFIAGCKKNSSGSGNPDNIFKATLSNTSGPGLSIDAHGNKTMFARAVTETGDTVIYVGGHIDGPGILTRTVSLTLANISVPGVYQFARAGTPGTRIFVIGSYDVANAVGLQEYYSTVDRDSTSTVIITSLTTTHITGSISSFNCGIAPNEVHIENVSFTGDLTH